MFNARCLWIVLLYACAVSPESLVAPPYRHSLGIRKATQAKLLALLTFRTTFRDPQGIVAVKMTARDDPETDDDDDELTVYGVNAGRHQLIYNTSMWSLAIYGSRGSGRGRFLRPRGITADPYGNVYVVDAGNNRVVHLYNPKRKARWVGSFGKTPGDPRALRDPSQVDLDGRGNLYVTDTGNRRIVVFDSAGAFVRSVALAPAVDIEDGPRIMIVCDGREPWSFYRHDRFMVCSDRRGRRLIKLSLDGGLLARAELPDDHAAAYGATDYYHNIWVTDPKNHCILKFDHDLRLLDVFGSRGEDFGRFIEPRGITIWKRYGQTFVAEKEGAQYYWIGTDVRSKKLSTERSGRIVLDLQTTEHSYIGLFRVNDGDTLAAFRTRIVKAGPVRVALSAREAGLLRGPGDIVLKTEPTYSSYTYYAWYYPLLFSR